MAWTTYNLDQKAHDLVMKYRGTDALNQSYKMRVAVSYGLERFWGEQFRLDAHKQSYWRDTWKALVEIMALAEVTIPNDPITQNNTQQIQTMAGKLWNFDIKQRKVAIAVLTQLCESMVWWTQRYK